MNKRRSFLAALVIGLLALTALGSATGSAIQDAPWLVEGNQDDAHLGQTVAPAGDVNGDGYEDLLIGGRYDFGDGGTGVAYAYYGSAQGLGTQPDWSAPNDQPTLYEYLALASAGDVNGDGYDDVVVGASQYTDDQDNEGRAYVYYGSSNGLSTMPGWVTDGNQRIMYYGTAVAGVGDVNGDGYDDVLIGAPYKTDSTGDGVGQALLYLGSVSGLSTTPAWTAEGAGGWSYFGGRLNAAGDVNGDGYDDFIVSAYFFSGTYSQEGRAFLYLGSSNGPASTPAWIAEGDQANSHFGSALGPAGDVNGDGYDDVIIGAPEYHNTLTHEGRATLYYGSANGLSSSPGWITYGNNYAAAFGQALRSAGDVNNDGYDDVIIGALGFDNTELAEGRAFLYLGSAGGLATDAAWTANGGQAQANFGSSVSSAGDVNGDGTDEWAVGAPQYDRGESNEGIAVVYSNLSTSPLPTPIPTTPPPPTATPAPAQIHISDLDGISSHHHNMWDAIVQVEVRDAEGITVDQAVVSGTWSTGEGGQCTTGVYGVCSFYLRDLRNKVGSVTFTVNDVQRTYSIYQPSANTDPDGDSNGTQITVVR